MNSVILSDSSKVATMTSREIAELVDSRHDSVKRTVERLAEKGVISQPPMVDGPKSANGVVEQVYFLDKRSSLIVVAQLCPEFTARIVDRWQDLEAKQAAPAFTLPDFTNPASAARAWAVQYEATQTLTIERDHAIATKAQIGSKREATAMATASAAKKESNALKEQLGFGTNFATVTAVQNATGEKFDWLPMRRWCKTHNTPANDVQDKRYGTVKAWPAGAWANTYGVDLMGLFGEAA